MSLVLGPLLRRVVGDRATVWVETAAPGTVEVRAGGAIGAAHTFTAFGHHFAFVVVDGLPAGAATPYQVFFAGEQVWPPPDYPYPPPVIRTFDTGAAVRLVFGSCRQANPKVTRGLPPDALDAYAARLARTGQDWPDALLLLGDQVYADDPAPAIGFDDYARLYHRSWTAPDVRWLLSTVPSAMICDDHEIIDDWNTSAAWRDRMLRQPWWRPRISAGLASYWVYQHLGNLPPDELGVDPLYPAVVSADDASELLLEFGARADDDRAGYRWSYCLDLGRTRLVVLDNRVGRRLTPGQRAMLPDAQWEWFAGLVREGGYEHLVVGSSLPWLLPFAGHHLERAVSALAETPRRPVAALAEWIRQAVDLEHWPAFDSSFEALTALLGQAATGAFGPAPCSISVLSGDVHHSYVARAALGGAPIHQLTCSPVHNRVPLAMRAVFAAAWSGWAAAATRTLDRLVSPAPTRLGWTKLVGPYFGTAVSTIVHMGQSASVVVEGTGADGRLVPVARVVLAEPDHERVPLPGYR